MAKRKAKAQQDEPPVEETGDVVVVGDTTAEEAVGETPETEETPQPESMETEGGGEEADAPLEEDEPDPEEDGEDSGEEESGEESDEEEGEDDGSGLQLSLTSVVEAVLFAAREPLKVAQIARAVGKRTRQDVVREAVEELNVQYLETGRAFEIAEISGKYQLMSRPEYADHIMRIYPKRELGEKDKTQRLTPAMLDTLAIIAYKQPVMRSEIDQIRGSACANHLRALIERGTVKELGRRTDLVGKPAVFGTTERFLAEFGLGSLEELPMRNDFVVPGAPPPLELVETAEEPANNETAESPAETKDEPVENDPDTEAPPVDQEPDEAESDVDDNEDIEDEDEEDEEDEEDIDYEEDDVPVGEDEEEADEENGEIR